MDLDREGLGSNGELKVAEVVCRDEECLCPRPEPTAAVQHMHELLNTLQSLLSLQKLLSLTQCFTTGTSVSPPH